MNYPKEQELRMGLEMRCFKHQEVRRGRKERNAPAEFGRQRENVDSI